MSLAPSVHSLWPVYWYFPFFYPHEPSLQTIPKHLRLSGFLAIPDQLPAICPHTAFLYPRKGEQLRSAHCLQVLYSSGVNFTPKTRLQPPASSLESAVSLFWFELMETRSVYACVCVGGGTGELYTAKRQLSSVLLCGDPTLQAEVDLGRGWLSGNHACKKHPLHSWEKTACS